MRLGRDRTKWLRNRAIPCICAVVLAYFGYHAVDGERGLLSWVQMSRAVDEAQALEAMLAAERSVLEDRVARLRPGALDADMLDQQARYMLNLARSDEVVIYAPAATATVSLLPVSAAR